jgi:dTDP-4-dehydrorhamnose 3,5-epimerase
MRVEDTELGGVNIVHLDVFRDDRGLFVETFDARAFAALGIDTRFVQDSFSSSPAKGTVRGLHFQVPPRAQAKLVRVTRGRVFDVVVDIRRASPTFGRHVALILDAAEWRQLFIPTGFAHGFCTLEADTEIVYKMSDHFSPEHYRGLLWSDPDLGISWPVSVSQAIVSDKDKKHPRLKDLPDYFAGAV